MTVELWTVEQTLLPASDSPFDVLFGIGDPTEKRSRAASPMSIVSLAHG
jgi:hypothetical protein